MKPPPLKLPTMTPEQYDSLQVQAGLGNPKCPVPGPEAAAYYAVLMKQSLDLQKKGYFVDVVSTL